MERQSSSPNLSFRPSITAAASRRPARGLDELSRGDALRREAHREQLRVNLQREADEAEKFSYTPQLVENFYSNAPDEENKLKLVESKLKLVEDPDSYLSRVAEARLKKELKVEQALEEKAMQELAQCTFSPQVKRGSPVFVRQMAENYRSARSLRESTGKAVSPRPDWK